MSVHIHDSVRDHVCSWVCSVCMYVCVRTLHFNVSEYLLTPCLCCECIHVHSDRVCSESACA